MIISSMIIRFINPKTTAAYVTYEIINYVYIMVKWVEPVNAVLKGLESKVSLNPLPFYTIFALLFRGLWD